MKSDIHKTFSVFQDGSPELINNVFARARTAHGNVHATLSKKTNPHISVKGNRIFMKLDTMLGEVSSKHQQKFWTCTCTHTHATHVNVCARFYIW